MVKGVLMHRVDSIYDDEPDVQYQFPKQYLSRAAQFVGDWIVYLEPVKAGKKGYHAIAKIENIVRDPTKDDHYLALIEPGSYLPFENWVPFSDKDGVVEQGLLNEVGKISGRAQAAVRPISLADFNVILDRGIPEEDTLLLPRIDPITDQNPLNQVAEDRTPFQFDIERDRTEHYITRAVRDRVFRNLVIDAYDRRCAITGLKFINGGGRAEVEAAHIKPVAHGGPDILNNGLALSGTAHWMFDRGLICLSDNMELQVSRHVNDIDSVWNLVNKDRTAALPADPSFRPHPRFLAWHRENCFKH